MNQAEPSHSFNRLKEIIDRLRGPDGCSWDRQQTHASLKPYLVEECYEVLHAIDEGKPEKLREELGDLLLQIMLHSRIADEAGQYDINEVMDGISDKLVHRHPHVFGEQKTESVGEIRHYWHLLKQEEKGKERSVLSGALPHMPALAYSQLIQRKVAAVGFDWEKTEDILDKLAEEIGELIKAPQGEKAEEFGDILFVLVNLARRLQIDAEMALRQANRKFFRRFSIMESICRERSVTFADLSFDEQNRLWEEAKEELAKEDQ
ncbi:MAG TPA: nucleoside triphosphate pyrophosphohydrolase [Dehalococcoidia bacterium]|nr:nucleoside triphosphate pyrophosphohydrolase [Dehalococcoidia bacterium]